MAKDRPIKLSSCRGVALAVTAALALSACGSEPVASAAATTNTPSLSCGTANDSPGLALQPGWVDGEERAITVATTSSGAGVDPGIDGLFLTTPISITASVQQETASIAWMVGDTTFADGTPSEISGAAEPTNLELGPSGEVLSIDGPGDEDSLERIIGDVELYGYTTSIGDNETRSGFSTLINPLTAQNEEAIETIEHLGTDEQGCELLRVTRHVGPQAIIDDLDDLLQELQDPNERPDAFADLGFDGAIVRTATYRFDNELERTRSVELTEAWGIFGAGGIDTRVTTRTFTDLS